MIRLPWAAPTKARRLIEDERAQPLPPPNVGERLWSDLQDILSRELVEENQTTALSQFTPIAATSPSATPGLQSVRPQATRSRPRAEDRSGFSRARKGAASLLGSLLGHAPLALASLIVVGMAIAGGYRTLRSGERGSGGAPAGHIQKQPATVPAASARDPLPSRPPEAIPVPDHLAGARPESRPPHAAHPHTIFPDSSLPALSPHAVVMAPDPTESEFLERARAAVREGRNLDALQSLATAAKLRRAIMVEEREALTVIALAHSGRVAEARQRAEIFSAQYPQSLYRRRLQSAVSPMGDDVR